MVEKLHPFSVILAAGGTGSRMQSEVPKQYLKIKNKPLALYSFEIFDSLPEVDTIVVVCDPTYHSLFVSKQKKVLFAEPGKRRQDSVFNGIQLLKGDPLVCVHDAARPLIQTSVIRRTAEEAAKWGAAVVGVRVKGTIKICDSDQLIVSTPDRKQLWEMQTPQIIRLSLLKEGYAQANALHLSVTDDVSLVERLEHSVKVVEGSYTNIKVTTPEDLVIVEHLMETYALL